MARPVDPNPTPARRSSHADLFDDYLDRALAGEVENPEAFLSARGIAGAPPPWLHQLHDLVQSSSAVDEGSPEGRFIGRYRLLRELGEGGMGIVYLAEESELGRHVALKVIRPELAASPTATERFRREAQALARIRHPGIAQVFAFEEADGIHHLAMELVPGEDLARRLERGRLSVREATAFARDVSRALGAAHEAGILHRDVKPSNVRIAPGDRAVLMDFGLARDLAGNDATLTRSFAGSPTYAAPEQLTGARPVDARTDVYGLGATLYEALTGRPPFDGDNLDQIMRRVLVEDPTPPRTLRPDVPRDLEAVALRALERDPERRYESADALTQELEAVLALQPVRARPPGTWRKLRSWARRHRTAAAAAIVLCGAAALALIIGLVVSHQQGVARREQAADLVREARAELSAHATARELSLKAGRKLRSLQARLTERVLNPGEARARQRFVRESRQAFVQRETVMARVLGGLTRARDLDPESPDLDRAWAELHFQQWLHLRQQDPVAAATHFERVRELDPLGDLAAQVLGVQRVTLLSDPPGATVHLFPLVSQTDDDPERDQRLVPRHAQAPQPGAPCLRVARDSAGLREGDLILVIEGKPALKWRESPFWLDENVLRGRTVTVRRQGETREHRVEHKVVVRPTAIPFDPSAATAIGSTPIVNLALEPGSYLAILEHDGHRRYRLPFHVDHAAEDYSKPRSFHAHLQTAEPPKGFVHLGGEGFENGTVLLRETEVTCGEYLRFLNDRRTQRRIAAGKLVGVPRARDPQRPGAVIAWPQDSNTGTFSLPTDLDPRVPVTGVSWHDARTYAQWLTTERGLDDSEWIYDLPAFSTLIRTAASGDSRPYVHGDFFNPRWIKSRFARRGAGLEFGLSYPIDESVFGVYDLQGSVAEWTADPTNPVSVGTRIVFGGSWADSLPGSFLLRNYRTLPPESAEGWVGFRMVLRPRRQ